MIISALSDRIISPSQSVLVMTTAYALPNSLKVYVHFREISVIDNEGYVNYFKLKNEIVSLNNVCFIQLSLRSLFSIQIIKYV